MGLKATLDTLDGLDQFLHQFYIKSDDGKSFKLDAEGVEDVGGLKSALTRQTDAARKNADEIRKLQERYKDIDPDQVRAIMGRMANDDEAKLIAEGKIDEVINKRIEKQKAALERQVTEANQRAELSDGRAKKFSQRVLDDQLRASANKTGVHASAVDDVLFRGRTMFSLDEDGKAIQLDSEGHTVLGKDGKNPFTPDEWLATMKETAPHWFPAATLGGGALYRNGAALGGGPDISKLTPAQRITEARKRGART